MRINPISLNTASIYRLNPIKKTTLNPEESDIKAPGRKSSPAECKTCKERKYQDGSDENVSFKSAQHISPEQAGTAVRAHENEHVANAYKKASEKGGQVVRASVSIQTAICPECGRSYIAGGLTSTAIKYPSEDKYQKERKAQPSPQNPSSPCNMHTQPPPPLRTEDFLSSWEKAQCHRCEVSSRPGHEL